jgi:hypothetical protein
VLVVAPNNELDPNPVFELVGALFTFEADPKP